jgi:hypothetical protein
MILEKPLRTACVLDGISQVLKYLEAPLNILTSPNVWSSASCWIIFAAIRPVQSRRFSGDSSDEQCTPVRILLLLNLIFPPLTNVKPIHRAAARTYTSCCLPYILMHCLGWHAETATLSDFSVTPMLNAATITKSYAFRPVQWPAILSSSILIVKVQFVSLSSVFRDAHRDCFLRTMWGFANASRLKFIYLSVFRLTEVWHQHAGNPS